MRTTLSPHSQSCLCLRCSGLIGSRSNAVSGTAILQAQKHAAQSATDGPEGARPRTRAGILKICQGNIPRPVSAASHNQKHLSQPLSNTRNHHHKITRPYAGGEEEAAQGQQAMLIMHAPKKIIQGRVAVPSTRNLSVERGLCDKGSRTGQIPTARTRGPAIAGCSMGTTTGGRGGKWHAQALQLTQNTLLQRKRLTRPAAVNAHKRSDVSTYNSADCWSKRPAGATLLWKQRPRHAPATPPRRQTSSRGTRRKAPAPGKSPRTARRGNGRTAARTHRGT